MYQDLLTALALLLVMEGILPFLNPAWLRRAMLQMSQMDDRALRAGGLFSMLVGVALLYLIK